MNLDGGRQGGREGGSLPLSLPGTESEIKGGWVGGRVDKSFISMTLNTKVLLKLFRTVTN